MIELKNALDYPKISNKRVLITGAAGFIGSNLVEDLLAQGNQVVGLDNLSTGFSENLSRFKDDSNFQLIVGDIRDLAICKQACLNTDLVLHQAALGSVPRSLVDPITTNDVNIGGFLNLLVAARDAKVKRFVYASSSSVYGDSTALPKVENQIGEALSPYAVTKQVNEKYAHVFHLKYGLEVVGLRYFNVFGKHQSPSGEYAAVIPKFVDILIRNESPVIHGDGSFSRDFTHIDNIVQMNHLAATTTNPAAIGQVFNVAYGESTTLLDLTKILIEKLSRFQTEIKNSTVSFGPTRDGDIPHSLASIDKAVELLGYQPKINLHDGLEKSLAWYWRSLK